MSNKYGNSYRGNANGYGNFGRPQQAPPQQAQQQQQQRQAQPQQSPKPTARLRPSDDYDPYGDGYVSSSSRERSRGPASRGAAGRFKQAEEQQQAPPQLPPPRRRPERQIGQETLDHIRKEWPSMCEADCVPVQMALQLLDSSSVGRAHEYRGFQETHQYLQDSLKGIVHDYHQGFNSSIGTFHKIQNSIQTSQKKVRWLKETLAASKVNLCKTDPELKKLYASSQMYDDLLQTLNDVDELRQVPERLEARISEKQFLTAVDVLQNALRKLQKPELDGIGGLSELRSYLANQETALMDILVEELHEHMYLKSPYCQERWQALAKHQGTANEAYYGNAASTVAPFYALLDGMEFEHAVREDPARNPERDTFYYITLVVESLNKLGRLEGAVDQLKQRLPVELFGVVNEAVTEVDRKHPSSLRGGSSANANGLHIYGSRETQLRADVIYDLLWTLYGKFEAIAEGHRVLHEYIKALIRREGAGNNSALLGSFKELWNLYQNEIRSLLHNYVTTDADLYRFSNSPMSGAGGYGGAANGGRKSIFSFAESDARSDEMAAEYEALDGIIRSAVPGLTSDDGTGSSNRRSGSGGKRGSSKIISFGYGTASSQHQHQHQQDGMRKPLVEPSVFNMSLLLPPTLVFLQRLKNIVPPGSDLATSTLTSFLDNFLVNVFQPQLDETLGKLSEAVFGEADAFQPDAQWSQVARKPVFKGTTAFFSVVTAFCRMLGTIPHDQALSTLIITQMMRYYDRCFSWYKALVTKTPERGVEVEGGEGGGIVEGEGSVGVGVSVGVDGDGDDTTRLRLSAVLALEDGDVSRTAKQLWEATGGTTGPTEGLLGQEAEQLMRRAARQGSSGRLDVSDVIADRETITSLCLLYTSMKWLAVKIAGLRHITQQDADSASTRSSSSLTKPGRRRWTLLHDASRAFAGGGAGGVDEAAGGGPVYLPMTQETAQSFDGIVSSCEELATTALLTLHLEVRCRIAYALGVALSPQTAPYLLDQEVSEPDPQILALNGALIAYDETAMRFLREREANFVRTGLGQLAGAYLVGNARMVRPMNSKGCGRMQLNILVLQQNLKNVEEGVDLARAANYYRLFEQGPDAIVAKGREGGGGTGEGQEAQTDEANTFSYDELKELIELYYSEQLANPERGIENAARRQMGEKLMELGEHSWQK
ncbi:exocyst complex component [Grosmannia clavigera kw1407]|uniref:Exocyst complex component Sec8 n=1 Tax=Grosmannia clavigera (strain kw1407 / UAMH 11150) TaxID=655863 RepID=F0XRB4_GROCL|nr:exocyst complex component [Grosmannia clavigera kw1407]EFW99826.1 exocyst complex component [Grosmannia clavigera kw1407]